MEYPKKKIISEGNSKRELVEITKTGKKVKSRTYHQFKLNGEWLNSKNFGKRTARGGK